MLQGIIEKLDARQRVMLIGGLILLLVAGSFSYVLLPRIKVYTSSVEARDLLRNVATQGQAVSQQLVDLSTDVEVLAQRLHGDAANLPDEQLESFVIGRLQAISWRNNVDLISIAPSAGESVQTFRESLFRVELLGSYFDLYSWLDELSDELGFVVIKEYEMNPVEDVARDPDLNVSLSIASYRLMQS